MEIKMRNNIVAILGALLVAGSVTQIATATTRHRHHLPVATSEQFRDANNAIDGGARTFCSQEAGNPYDKETDYMAWSAFRDSGAWDSRNDCR
jgi:hypothetical protein